MNQPPEQPSITVMLPVKLTYNPEGLLWYIAEAQSPEVRERNALVAVRDMFSGHIDYLNGVVDSVPPTHIPDVIVSLPTEVKT